MPRLTLGVLLCLALALSLASCRKDAPPSIEICQGDGFGGADCVERDGSKVYKKPTDLENYWMTNQEDMKAFASWCYDTGQSNVVPMMRHISKEMR